MLKHWEISLVPQAGERSDVPVLADAEVPVCLHGVDDADAGDHARDGACLRSARDGDVGNVVKQRRI